MPVFNFPQFEHEPFWSYFSRLNDYRAQLNRNFEKWEICEVIILGLNSEFKGHVESMCPGGLVGLLSKTQDEVWDFFENLGWETYEFEQANQFSGYPTSDEYAFYANPSPPDHFLNSYDPSYSYMPPVLCDYCESPSHDVSTCPYRATCARLEKKIDDMTDQMIKLDDMNDQFIETMKLRIVEYSQCFNQNRKTYSEHDSRLGSPEPAVSLNDDFGPSYSTRPDLNENMCLPSLEQESDPLSL